MTPDEFWGRVDRSGGEDACWPWTGCTDANGYGWLRWRGRRARAHVVVLELDGRPVPPGQVGRHLCTAGVRRCCNPKHLTPGTHAQNAQDRQQAGRGRNRRLLSVGRALELRTWYRRGLATSVELAGLFQIPAERVRHIGSDAAYRTRKGDMNNGTAKKLAEAAVTLGRDLEDVGKDERAINGYFLALYKRHEARRLVVAHRDERPSVEEAVAIAALVGVPEGSEPLASQAWVACQDMPSLRVKAVEFRWQEVA